MATNAEAQYQMELIPRIYKLFPDCKMLVDIIVYITDPNYIQGIPDILVIVRNKYAFLEVKLSEKSKQQPNQGWYVENWNRYTFSSFIYPENEREVLHALQSALGA